VLYLSFAVSCCLLPRSLAFGLLSSRTNWDAPNLTSRRHASSHLDGWQEIKRSAGDWEKPNPPECHCRLFGCYVLCAPPPHPPHALVNNSNITSFASAGTTAVSTLAINPIVGLDGRRGICEAKAALASTWVMGACKGLILTTGMRKWVTFRAEGDFDQRCEQGVLTKGLILEYRAKSSGKRVPKAAASRVVRSRRHR
jgi:hypothetical protein